MSYPDEEKIQAYIEEIVKHGYCVVDGKTISEPQVIGKMVDNKNKMSFIVSRIINKLPDMAEQLVFKLYEKHARSLVIDALASVEREG